jgi:hypothetical protein
MGDFGGQKWVKNGSKRGHFWDPFLNRSCSEGLKISLREAIFQPKPVKNRSKSGPKRGQKVVKNGSKMGHFWTPF